jgi:hypothetical protein
MAKQLQKKFIGDNQVDGSKILLENNQSIKIKDSTGTEVDLVKLGASNEVLVKGQEVAIKSELTQEIADRISGDSSTLSSANSYADAQDVIYLGQAQDYTDTEISGLQSFLQGEISSGDAATLVSANAYTDQEVLAEETARIAADASLQSQIDAITGGGSGSLAAVQSELDSTQAGAGLGVDGSYTAPVGSNYLGSATSLKNADTLLDSQIKIVADGLANVISNVDPGALDSLTEIVTAFQAADSSLNGAITSLSTSLAADIDAEESARIAADSALQGEIDAEELARAAADTTLQNNINSEASARAAADTALDGRVSVLESVVWFKEKFSISNGQTSITLSHTPESNSMSAFVDRLAIHQGAAEDYTISGVTMTFLNDLVSPGQSQIGNGDTVYVKYQYKV